MGPPHVENLTGIDERTRDDYRRDVDLHLSLLEHQALTQQTAVPATICNLTQEDVNAWVRVEEKGEHNPDKEGAWLRRKADPKSIRNRHGLLYCIVQAAVESTPQLRTQNCCTKTRLPREDDHTDEEMTFLERDEYTRIAAEITDPAARDLADWLAGTGMRWGEATALKVSDVNLTAEVPTVSVQRAWKRSPKGQTPSFFLGPPKTRKARRTLALSPLQVDMLRRLVTGRRPDGFVFRAAIGGEWRHVNFYNRKWIPAAQAAVAKGLPKRPRIHDLRHTHVAWLIAARIPLPAIQARLGHESIQTTVDRYGHLVRGLDAEITAAVEAAMAVPVQRVGLRPVSSA
ncbi:site-specific integrase [Streptomyces sp. NA04227]|uniref:tyrosine-type recombinase/integrase n=1 Tax=Streptomyces sp. NA04227 TaxID=2742136 RepID=UPI0020CA8932|nr:site-specific integrase [Streptomyces sp. NA04227]